MTSYRDPHDIGPAAGAETGRRIMERWRRLAAAAGGQEAGRALVEACLRRELGFGDKYDVPSTLVDIVAYLAHHAAEEGIDLAGCVAAAADGGQAAEGELTSCLAALKDYCAEEGFSYEDVVRIGLGHAAIERSGPAPR